LIWEKSKKSGPYSLARLGGLCCPRLEFSWYWKENEFQPDKSEYIQVITRFCYIISEFTPLNLNRDLRATLPINELKGKPPTEVCPILNIHRCKDNRLDNAEWECFCEGILYDIIVGSLIMIKSMESGF
jgi:hypothetical protein